MRIPLFPLNTVLFPGATLGLQIFEPRYREMIAGCLATRTGFGVALIRTGREVGDNAIPYDVGTYAEIEAFMREHQLGLLETLERVLHPLHGLFTTATTNNNLRQQRVIEGRYIVSGVAVRIDSDLRIRRWNPSHDSSRVWPEPVVRKLGIDSTLKSMAGKMNVSLTYS